MTLLSSLATIKLTMAAPQQKKPRIYPIILLGVFVVGFGTVVYHYIEDLSWINSLYFCVITLTTIGYGDIVPTTDVGKLFTVFYVLVGISLLAGVANYLIRHALVERWERKHPDEKLPDKLK